jgi:thiol-disulfide isomerase/thioredoxin
MALRNGLWLLSNKKQQPTQNKMQNFTTALKAEHIKKKGTGFYLLALILGAISPIIYLIVSSFESMKFPNAIPKNYYTDYIENCLEPFAGFFFPLLIIIIVSRITQLDHKNGGWQLMETQPVRKTSIYFSKFTVVLLANIIAISALIVVGYLCAWILTFIKDIPESATTNFEFGKLILIVARLLLAGLFFTAFQYIISVIMPSFIWSILIGFFLLLLFIFLKAFNVTPDWYPLELLNKTSTYKEGSELGYWLTYSEAVSVLCSIITLYIGFKWYKYKKLKWAFFGNAKRFAMLAAVLLVFGALLAYTLQPNVMPRYTKTIISGKIEGDKKMEKIYVRDLFIRDTLAIIPVTNNNFNYEIKEEMPLDKYELIFDGTINVPVIMGTKDSIYLVLKSYKNSSRTKITGTRLAENSYNNQNEASWSMASYYIERNDFLEDPTFITKQIVDEWNEAMDESDKFKTVDNYIPREDFIKKNKKLLTIDYLNLWNELVKKRAVLFPEQKTEETAGIKEMKKIVPLNDESLLSDEKYFNYITSQLVAANDDDIDENTKSIQAINKMEQGSFRDKMLYYQLNKSLEEASTKQERDSLISQYSNNFKDDRYKMLVLNNRKTIENLSKGQPAPLFDAITLNNEPFNLADLKGKFVVIDVWATWCAPCKYQSPYFEKFAIKYKKQPIQFVALSTDERIDAWVIEAKTKSESVLQLHVSNNKQFSKDYNLVSIPRFIFINPEGQLINSNMPYPASPFFEQLIRQSLGLEEQK